MNVTGPCRHHFIICQLIRAQRSCFTNRCSIYVYGCNETTPLWPDSLLGEFTKASESRINETSLRLSSPPGEFTMVGEIPAGAPPTEINLTQRTNELIKF